MNRYGRRAMASAYQEDDGFRRQKGMCEKAVSGWVGGGESGVRRRGPRAVAG